MLDDAQDVDSAIVSLELAVAIVGAEPLVDDVDDSDATAAQAERERQLSACVVCRFDLEAHEVLIALQPA